jgi:hypothetical protein
MKEHAMTILEGHVRTFGGSSATIADRLYELQGLLPDLHMVKPLLLEEYGQGVGKEDWSTKGVFLMFSP